MLTTTIGETAVRLRQNSARPIQTPLRGRISAYLHISFGLHGNDFHVLIRRDIMRQAARLMRGIWKSEAAGRAQVKIPLLFPGSTLVTMFESLQWICIHGT
jgi:hypothetical protein